MRISDWSSDVCSSDLPGQKNSRGRCSEPVELTAWRAVSMPTQGASFLLRPILDRFDCCLLAGKITGPRIGEMARSEEHTSELQSLMRISYAVFCLKKKKLIMTI